ncbi:MAG TPA: glycosyltransferase [Chloroflexia bacterium]|nr:glycosyltransferase [Chloroflexia bacterium]
MKILSVVTYYHPHWTGLTVHATRVAEGLAVRGHQVTVLTTRHSPDLARDEMLNGVRVIRLQPVSRFNRGMITPAFPHAAWKLAAMHDVVQIHTPLPEAPVVALICRAQGKPLLMTHHGDVVMPAGLLNQTLEKLAFVLLRSAGQLADGVTSYSRDYADNSRLLRGLSHKLTCVYPPVDFPAPDQAAVAARRAELGLEGKRLIGFAGRWVREKGFDYLLKAMPLVREAVPGAHLVYAGETNIIYESFYEECRPMVEAQKEHITFMGLLRDPRDMANFYAMCDLFVLPSRTDMMALVQVEAMLSGTPVVATDIPGARVVVRDTGFGRLSPPRDHLALARTLAEALTDPDPPRPTPEAVRRTFSTERSLEQYESTMARLARERVPEPARLTARASSRAHASAYAFVHAYVNAFAPLNDFASGRASVQSTARPAQRPARGRKWRSLTREDHRTLDRIMRNEADMAYRRRARILLDYLDLHDGDRVLDCGCGFGVYLMMMGRLRDLRMVGLDGQLDRLQTARREGVPAGLVRGDILRLPFADESFDKIIMSEVLEHLPDDRRGLSELYRILRPGGVLAISVPHARYPFWWDPINSVWTRLGGEPFRTGPLVGIWSGHERLYEPDDLAERIAGAGFRVDAVEEATHYSFPFAHFLVYGIGKPLFERNLLPASMRASADRFRGEENSGSLLNPINIGLKVFRAIDRRNERPSAADAGSYVNVLVRAVKP